MLLEKLNGSVTKWWRTIIFIFISMLMAITGWAFVQVRDLPQNFTSSRDFRNLEGRVENSVSREDFNKCIDRLREDIYTSMEKQNQNLEKMDNKLSRLQEFLINYFSNKDEDELDDK